MENVFWVDKSQLEVTLSLPDFFRLIPYLRRYQIRIRLKRKQGMPFWIRKIKKRVYFYIGFLLFIVLLFVLSSFIWQIEIVGAETIPHEQVYGVLQKEGIFKGQLKFRLPKEKEIQERLLKSFSQASWIGFQLEGTRAIVTIVMKKQIEEQSEDQKDEGPVDLIAGKDALVVDMQIQRGRAVVGLNEVVQKGDLLVSGKYGDPLQETDDQIVGAKGKVLGEVWYEAEVAVPFLVHRKEYTGRRDRKTHFFVGTKVLHNPFKKSLDLKQYETTQTMRSFYLGNWKMPFGLVDEERLEMNLLKYRRTFSEAVQLAKQSAKDEMISYLDADGKIINEKVLHQRVDNGKVYLKIHFDVVENIAVSQPILQGE